MPIYEYRCTACGHTLEVIQKYNDAPLAKCTECAGKLEKLISRSAFQLKGGGWYSEGYGGGGSGGSGGTGSGSSAAPAAKSGAGDKDGSKPSGGKKAASGGGCGSGACGCH